MYEDGLRRSTLRRDFSKKLEVKFIMSLSSQHRVISCIWKVYYTLINIYQMEEEPAEQSVLRRQCWDANLNIKMLVYCQYG